MKKMRRLIPAIAMLLVSAVMLSTASFAWFTMNESVTATGMEVKAKASGNLLISESKMTAADQAITVALTNRNTNGATDIIPVTYTTTWQVPTDASKVDPLYGGMAADDTLKNADKSVAYMGSPYFVDYTVYVATAGEDLTDQHLYVTMNMVSALEDIANAYSIAFYVGEPAQGADLGTFAGYINYKTFADAAAAGNAVKVYLNGAYTIPTTFEKNTDTAAGLRITMRVFVDGNLKYDAKVPTQVPAYVDRSSQTYAQVKAQDTQNKFKYYKLEGGKYIQQDMSSVTDSTTLTGYYTWDGTTMSNGPEVDKYYVNNADIPTAFTSFDVTIGATATNAMPTGNDLVTTKGIPTT